MLRLTGNRDGSAAVDYTVNAASGFPLVTGQGGMPVNHVLPAWDIAAGLYLATALLAAERHRSRTGEGQEVVAALSDVMLATVGNLGYIGDVQINGTARPAIGNDLYGSFGRDFATADGRRVMIIALTRRQWRAIGEATGLGERLAMIGPMMDVDLDTEAGRYEARDAIASLLARWCAGHILDEIRQAFAGTGVLWGQFQEFRRIGAPTTRAAPRRTRCSLPSISPASAAISCPACHWIFPPTRVSRRSRRLSSASTPISCLPKCSVSPRPRSGGFTMSALSPGRMAADGPQSSRSRCRSSRSN